MTTATTSVKVLNASFEELGTTKLSRAIALVTSGKAVVEEEDTFRVLRSVNGSVLPLPRVIRLLNYLKVPFIYAPEFWSKAGILRRDKGRCGYCGKVSKNMTVDHIIPRSRFVVKTDADTWENTITCCQKDNSFKADRTPVEAGMKLLYEPWTPSRIYLRSPKKPSKR